jgi:glycosyltransferase involved in cell wall biosynthesis
MRVLVVHNRYQQRGGEDSVVDAEVALLGSAGVDVRRFDADNDSIHGLIPKIRVSAGQLGFPTAKLSEFKLLLGEFCPDVVHVHNWFATLSPSIFNICNRAGIPVVHTLHNYRLLCASATLFRDGHVCEDCVGTSLRMPGILHACYRSSRAGTAVATAAMVTHWSIGTWTRSVNRFIALSEFAKNKVVEGGLPEHKIVVKPNFVDPDPGAAPGRGNYLLYAGRLTEEKGLRVLLECWKDNPDLPLLKIAGTGPLHDEVKHAVAALPNVSFVGSRSGKETGELMGNATALLCPSLWYEGMPRVVIEAFALGTPVIASRIGCYPEMITDGQNGILFPVGNAAVLRMRIRELAQSRLLHEMRATARNSFETHYTGAKNVVQLLNLYRSVQLARTEAIRPAVPART